MVIREDIINKALNESINEFMIEEGFWRDAWNGIKNGVAMYMDNATNGQWNRQYNIHAKGNGIMVVSHYFKQWLQYHYNRLQDLIYGQYYGNRINYYYIAENYNNKKYDFTHNWKDNTYSLKFDNGESFTIIIGRDGKPMKLAITDRWGTKQGETKEMPHFNNKNNSYTFVDPRYKNTGIVIYEEENNETPEEYVANQCNYKNFESAYKNVIVPGGTTMNKIYAYINKIQEINADNKDLIEKEGKRPDYHEIISYFNINKFYIEFGDLSSEQQTNAANSQQYQSQQGQAATNNTQGTANTQTRSNPYADSPEVPSNDGNINNRTKNDIQKERLEAERQRKIGNFGLQDEIPKNEGKKRRKAF